MSFSATSAASRTLFFIQFFSYARQAVANDLAGDLKYPVDLSCADRPEWNDFRIAANVHAARGWPLSTDDPAQAADLQKLEDTARKLVDDWRWIVCSGDCRTSMDMSWHFLEEIGARCADSGHFDRYLVTHYFRNRGLEYTKKQPGDYCHYGFITALVIRAQFEFKTSVAHAQRLLFLGFVLLGDFYSLDWLESSGWPVTSLMLTLNLFLVSQRLLTGSDVDFLRVTFPGEIGDAENRLHSRWQGTSEAGKKIAQPWDTDGLEPQPKLTIWQYDQHTSLAGEAKNMLVGFAEAIGIDTKFIGNSLAESTCINYDLCQHDPAITALINEYLHRYKGGEAFTSVAPAFARAMQPLIAPADVVMCTQPLHWCRFLMSLGKTIFLYGGLPVMWDVHEAEQADWAEDFHKLLVGQQHVVIAQSVLYARMLHWQFGVRVPAQRVLGLHAKATYAPLLKDKVLVSRFGTSGGLSECVFERFLQANPEITLEFVQLEKILFENHLKKSNTDELDNAKRWQDHTGEIKVPEIPYMKLAQHRAAIFMPYDAMIFLFNELYSANMPVFVPRDLWRWLLGLQTLPSLGFQRDFGDADPSWVHGPGPEHKRPRTTPFFTSVHRPMDVQSAVDWVSYSDWALFPHVIYFRGVPDLLLQLLDTDKLHEVSSKMKVFNDQDLVASVQNWKKIAHRLLFAARLSGDGKTQR